MSKNIGETILDGLVARLVEEKSVLLEVEITTVEQAEEIVDWIYSTNHPFKTKLLRADWGLETNPKGTQNKLSRIMDILEE